MTVVPDTWDELCLVEVYQQGGTAVAFAALTEDISGMDWGEKDIEGKKMLSGGNVVRRIPMTDESITLKMYPISAGNPAETTATGIMQHFHPGSGVYGTTDDSAQPISVANTLYRRKFRLTLLWATTLPATATTIPTAGVYAYRVQIFNAYLTSVKPDYGDKQLAVEATFKWTPFQKDGTRNKLEESCDDSAGLGTATAFA